MVLPFPAKNATSNCKKTGVELTLLTVTVKPVLSGHPRTLSTVRLVQVRFFQKIREEKLFLTEAGVRLMQGTVSA